MPLPDGYTMRPPRLDDAEPLVTMMNEETQALVGVPMVDIEWLTVPWSAPGVDLEHDFAVLLDPGGRIVGYFSIESQPPYTSTFSIGAVALDQHGRGLGAAILEEVERRSARYADRAPADHQVVLRLGSLADEPGMAGLFTAHGYREARRFWVMRIEFGEPQQPPAAVPEIEIRPLEPGQESAVYRCMFDGFQDHWGPEYPTEEEWLHNQVHASEHFHPELWLLAWQGEQLAGALLARPDSVQEEGFGYIGQLAVRRAFRRRGIGEALLRTSFAQLQTRGCLGALLHVDGDSITGATRLYERAGMVATPQWATWEKELRTGSVKVDKILGDG